MSDLQIGLLALGAAIIGAVLFYNWRQERNLAHDARSQLDTPAKDPLLDTVEHTVAPELAATAEIEPGFDLEEAMRSTQEEPVVSEPAEAAEPPQDEPGPAVTALPPSADEHIDLVALLRLPAVMAGESLQTTFERLEQSVPGVFCFAQDTRADWHRSGESEAAGTIQCLACVLQLADRSGAVPRNLLAQFRQEMDALAVELGAGLEWHGSNDPEVYAEELDQFCVDVDVMLSLHISSNTQSQFAGTKLRGLAEAGGLALQADGNFHCQGDGGGTLFMLVNQDQRPFTPESLRNSFFRGVTFQLDVPHASDGMETFNHMVLLARRMEIGLGGQLVDGNQNPLTDANVDRIRQRLKELYTRMARRGILPGTLTARRLFS